MSFEPIAEVLVTPRDASVYAEGWQSWSAVALCRADRSSLRPPDDRSLTMGWRPGTPLPEKGIQAEGILALAAPDAPARAWFAPDPSLEVASIRLAALRDRIVVSADAPLQELAVDGQIGDALAAVGDRLSPGAVAPIPPGWCSWSYYYGFVTEPDIVENVEAARRLSLPIEIFQIDDGYEACVGDWLAPSSRFGSPERAVEHIVAAGARAGVWTAPFLVGERSALAEAHPDWLVAGADAGWNWGQRLHVLDITHPAAAEHLADVYRTLAAWGLRYHKLDFLYAGAIPGRRHVDCTPLAAYRHGLRIIRDAAGPEATLVGSGAPLLPSIGLVDAMRIGPDVLPESPDAGADVRRVIRATRVRAWMHARLWANDPDCLVARPEIAAREVWASHLEAYGGVAFSGDRLEALDARGLELTRLVLKPSSTEWSATTGPAR